MSSRDPLQELEGALSFHTSPDFAARVRRRVAAQPMRSRGLTTQDMAVAAAVILTAGAGLVATLNRDVELPQPGRPFVVNAAEPPAVPGVEMVAASVPVVVRRRPDVVRALAPVSSFETLVPDDQRRALDRLLASMRAGSATVPAQVLDEELNENGQRVPRALVIEPMKLELLPGTPGENKDPVKDPIK
jgi:hypothetical protein